MFYSKSCESHGRKSNMKSQNSWIIGNIKNYLPDLPAPHILQYAGLRVLSLTQPKIAFCVDNWWIVDVFRREQKNLAFPTATRMSWINEKFTETIYDSEKIW